MTADADAFIKQRRQSVAVSSPRAGGDTELLLPVRLFSWYPVSSSVCRSPVCAGQAWSGQLRQSALSLRQCDVTALTTDNRRGLTHFPAAGRLREHGDDPYATRPDDRVAGRCEERPHTLFMRRACMIDWARSSIVSAHKLAMCELRRTPHGNEASGVPVRVRGLSLTLPSTCVTCDLRSGWSPRSTA